jgi:hypothetical protein
MINPFRRTRRVRVQLKGNQPAIEGLQRGRRPIAGHYVLTNTRLIVAADRSVKNDAPWVEIPVDNVVLIEGVLRVTPAAAVENDAS